MIATMYVCLVIAAFALSFYSLVQTKGDSALAWAVFCLSLAMACFGGR